MRKPLPQVRYIKPENIQVGDIIRITRKFADTEQSIVGAVDHIKEKWGEKRYYTRRGLHLLTTRPGFQLDPGTRITLLKAATLRTQLEFELS